MKRAMFTATLHAVTGRLRRSHLLIVGCRKGRRERIRGIGPEHSREVVQRDTRAPAIGSGPDEHRRHYRHRHQAQDGIRTHHSEVDQDDHDEPFHSGRVALPEGVRGSSRRVSTLPESVNG